MARAFLLAVFLCALLAAPAQAGFVDAQVNDEWFPRVDFALADVCAEQPCTLTARLTFHHKGKLVGRMNLTSPSRTTTKLWSGKPYDYADLETGRAWYFFACGTPGKHTWSAEIWAITRDEDGNETRTDFAPESGAWRQRGCDGGVPWVVKRSFAKQKLAEDLDRPNRTIKSTACSRPNKKKRPGTWRCRATWEVADQTCSARFRLFFYQRKMFGFDRSSVSVGPFEKRRCS